MTAGPSIDPARFLTEQLGQASADLMRDLLTTFVNALLSAQADWPSIIRLVGAALAEQHDEWAEGRRYLGLDVLARAQAVDTRTTVEGVTEPELQALTA